MKTSTKSTIKFIIGGLLLLARLNDILGGHTGFYNGSGGEVLGYNAFVLFSYVGGIWLIYSAIKDLRKKSY